MTSLLPFAFALPVAIFAAMATVCCLLVTLDDPRPRRHWVALALFSSASGFLVTDLIRGLLP